MNISQKKNILLVDDDPFLQSLYRKTLEREGFVMSTVNDGLAAVEKISEINPDLLVLDLMLPKLDGLKVLESIRRDPNFQDLPILILSNAYLPQVAQKAMKAGATSGILKSECSPKQLVHIIREHLRNAPEKTVASSDGPASWLSGLIGRKADQSETEAPAASDEVVSSESSQKSEAESELIKSWPMDISMIRAQCLKYVKTSGSQEADTYLRDIYRRLRLLTARSTMAEWPQVSELSSAMEAMLFERGFSSSKTMSQSAVQTLFQAVDCLEYLFKSGRSRPFKSIKATRILLVDDDPVCNCANQLALKRVNFETVCVDDGVAALALLENSDFDLILLDINMPVLSGLEVCEKLRDIPRCKETPVVFVTIQDDFQSRAQSVLCGGNGLISKPISPLELIVKALVFLLRPPNNPAVARERLAPKESPAPSSSTVAASGTPPVAKPLSPPSAAEAGPNHTPNAEAPQAPALRMAPAVTPATAVESLPDPKSTEEQAAECARRMGELERALAENQQSREKLGREIRAAKADDVRRCELETALAQNEERQKSLMQQIEEAWVTFETQQQNSAPGQPLVAITPPPVVPVGFENQPGFRERAAALDQAIAAEARQTEAEPGPDASRELQTRLCDQLAEQEHLLAQHTQEWENNRVVAEARIAELTRALDSEKRRSEEARAQAETVAQQRQALETELAASHQAQAKLSAELAEHKQSLVCRTEEVEAGEQKVQEKIQEITRALAEERQRAEAARRQADDMAGQKQALASELASGKQAQAQLQAKLTEQQQWLDQEVGSLSAKTSELEAGRAALEEKARALEQLLAEQASRCEIAEQDGSDLARQRDALASELDRSAEAQAQLQSQLAEVHRTLDARGKSHEEEIGKLSARSRELEAEQSASRAKIDEQAATLAAETARRQELLEQADTLDQQRKKLEEQVVAGGMEQEQLRTRLAELQQSLDSRVQELSAAQSEGRRRIAELDQALAAETQRCAAAEQQAARIDMQRQALAAELAARDQSQAGLAAQLTAAQQSLVGRSLKFEAGQVAREKQISDLKQTLAAETNSCRQAEQAAADLRQVKSALERDLAASRDSNTLLAGQQQLLEQRSRHFAATQAETGEKLKAVTEALATETKRWESARQQAVTLTQQRDALESEVAAAKENNAKLAAQVEEQQQSLVAQVQAHNADVAALLDLEAKRAALDGKADELAQSLGAETKRRCEAEEQAASLCKTAAKLEARLAEGLHVLDARIQAHDIDVASLKKLESAHAALEEKLRQLNETLAAESSRCQSAEQKVVGLGQERQTLASELTAAKENNAQLAAQLGEQQQLVSLTSAELEGFRHCAAEEASRHQKLAAEFAELEKNRADLASQLQANQSLLASREAAAHALETDLQQSRDAQALLDQSLRSELEQRRQAEGRAEDMLARFNETAAWLAQKTESEEASVQRESELRNTLARHQDTLAKSTAQLAERNAELTGATKNIEDLQAAQASLAAQARELTAENAASARLVQDLQIQISRTASDLEGGRKELAALRYAVLDAARLNARLQREHSQQECQQLDSLRQQLSVLAQTPLSLAQLAQLAELQRAVDEQKKSRASGSAYPVAMPLLQSSEFDVAEIAASVCHSVHTAAESAGVTVRVSAKGTPSLRVVGHPEHLHQLLTLLAASPIAVVPGVSALDLHVAVKTASGFVKINLRAALSTDRSAQELLSRLTEVAAHTPNLQAAALSEAEFGLAAAWQLAAALGAAVSLELEGKRVCLEFSLRLPVAQPAAVETPVNLSGHAEELTVREAAAVA